MNFESLQSFLAVTKYKSLSKAATSLHITQPTLSARIKSAEEYFNVKLFDRDWSGVRLTNYGLYLLPYAVRMLSKLNDFISVANNFKGTNNESLLDPIEGMHKTLRIGINNYLAPCFTQNIIDVLVSTYPDIRFEFFSGSSSNLQEFIAYDAVDCIIFYSNTELDKPRTHLIDKEKMVLALSTSDFKHVADDIMQLKTLDKPVIVNGNPTTSSYLEHFHKAIHQFELTKFQMVENMDVIRQLVEANLGYAVVPVSMFYSYFTNSSVRLYEADEYLPTLSLYMTYNKTSHFQNVIQHIYKILVSMSKDKNALH